MNGSQNASYDDVGEDWRPVVRTIWAVSIAILNTVGTLGNLLIVLVCSRLLRARHNRTQTATFEIYLMALAVVDLLALWTSALRRLFNAVLVHNPEDRYELLCRAMPYANMVTTHVATWYVCAMAVDRTLHIWKPLHSRKLCSTATTFGVLAAIALLFVLLDMPIAVVMTVSDYEACTSSNAHVWFLGFYIYHFSMYHIFVYSFLPFLVILSTALLIVLRLVTRRPLPLTTSPFLHNSSFQRKDLHNTILILLPTTIAFLACTLPSTAMYLYQDYFCDGCMDEYGFRVATTLFEVLVLVNHSMNFLIYGIRGSQFRRTALEMLARRKRLYKHMGRTMSSLHGELAPRRSQTMTMTLFGSTEFSTTRERLRSSRSCASALSAHAAPGAKTPGLGAAPPLAPCLSIADDDL